MGTNMNRRSFIKGAALTAAVGAAGAIGGTLAGCSGGSESQGGSGNPQAKDGTYEASSLGFLGDVTVSMSVKGGLVEQVSIADMGETPEKGGKAARVLEERIAEAKGLDGVDAVTGATATSRAVFRATEDCLMQAGMLEEPGDATMRPGTYVGEARGFDWIEPVRVKVEVDETGFKSVEITDRQLSREDPCILKAAEDLLIPRMVEQQSVTVDAVTGATSVCAGIRTATEQALKKALAAGGSNATAIHRFYGRAEKQGGEQTLDYDIVVCGLGGAGSAAAMSAAETLAAAGKEVRILGLETAGKYGGTAAVAGEPFSVNAPRYIEKYNNGEPWCDYDSLYEDWMATYSKGTPCKPECVKLLMDESGKTVDWLQFDHGFVFSRAKPGFGTPWQCKQEYVFYSNREKDVDYAAEYPDYTFVSPYTSAGQYFDHIHAEFDALGGDRLLETEAYELLLDDSGKVAGVKARSHVDGTEYTINAKAVILCTGGFCGSGSMTEKYLQNPEYPQLAARWHLWGMYQNKGAMIDSAIQKGAGTYNIDMPPCIHFSTTSDYLTEYPCRYRDGVDDHTQLQNLWSINDIPMIMGTNGSALQVSAIDGVRHYNESGIFAFWAGGPSWFTIYGSDYVDSLAENGLPGEEGMYQWSGKVFGQGGYPQLTPIPQIYEVLETAEAKGYVFKADTLEELAEKIGVPADAFVEQVARYESYCASGVDEEFGKSKETLLSQINQPPYYAIKADAAPYATVAALDVNTDLNVLKADGTTKIDGLYACGNDSGGVLYSNLEPYARYGGVALGWAFTSGRLAGANAAAYVAGA